MTLGGLVLLGSEFPVPEGTVGICHVLRDGANVVPRG